MADLVAVIGIVALVVGWMFFALLIARDTDRHGGNGGLTGAAFVLMWPLGILLWLRSRATSRESEVGSLSRGDAGPVVPAPK